MKHLTEVVREDSCVIIFVPLEFACKVRVEVNGFLLKAHAQSRGSYSTWKYLTCHQSGNQLLRECNKKKIAIVAIDAASIASQEILENDVILLEKHY